MSFLTENVIKEFSNEFSNRIVMNEFLNRIVFKEFSNEFLTEEVERDYVDSLFWLVCGEK